jgi:hypothetical protein
VWEVLLPYEAVVSHLKLTSVLLNLDRWRIVHDGLPAFSNEVLGNRVQPGSTS